jgi:hypothetical protein
MSKKCYKKNEDGEKGKEEEKEEEEEESSEEEEEDSEEEEEEEEDSEYEDNPRRSRRIQDNKRKRKEKETPKKNSPKKSKKSSTGDLDLDNLLTIYVLNSINELAKQNKNVAVAQKVVEKTVEEKYIEKNMYGPFFPKDSEKVVVPIVFDKVFDSLSELISLGERYDPGVEYDCYIDMKKLHKIVEPLKELDAMIGLSRFKRTILDQLVHILTSGDRVEMMHTCLYSGPGMGKTTCAKILGAIYAKCGLLSKGELVLAKREDFIGEYLGSTTNKTKKLLDRCRGNVLFIDEVYSLGSGNGTNRDSFSKEAIDSLNAFLSENCSDFICIIAGYKEDVERCFFSVNIGLDRRFPYKHFLDNYTPKEMAQMFYKFLRDEQWTTDIEEKTLESFFTEHKASFPYYGGDIKTLIDKCKVLHSRKIIILDKDLWKCLSLSDITEGFSTYLEERQVKKESPSHLHMYL